MDNCSASWSWDQNDDGMLQAVESWGDPNLIDVLRAHREAEAWLADYIVEVTGDLQT